ncbi:hypothetical protein ACIBED_03300 [Rhodococcus coprophilus]|uniref:Lipoprotein n=1 Tax=Rhodococcus coprophilus TaxID=38310 RepID=A0A2X4WPA1_9NOCA|nr:hypothetical protein [Rhodococcus coprophilus]MBM7460961.1 DNA-binding beta-propeller fold protein YncE [Rhodococcus coprophilus]SQI28765.1 lipoprotein [Rhodococcus coprophilus]
MDRPGIRGTALVLGVAVAVLTGCSAEDASETIQTIEPATPAVAPSVTPTPAGTVRPLDYRVDDLIVGETGTLAALADEGTRLLLLDDPAAEPQVVTLPAEAATLVAGPGGTILAPASGVVAQIDTSDGTVAEVPVDADAVSAAVLGDGRWAVGTSDGRVLIVDPGTSEVAETIGGLASADLIAVSGDSVAALDRRQTSLTSIDIADAHLGAALRAGRGATQLTTDPYGRVIVTDTTGDELLVYTIDELILRQRYPVGPAPYAVAYDDQRDLVWVTLTGSNEVVGYDLSTGTAEERHRFATVRQPNSVAVDPADGTLVIASATGDGLQRIPIEG